MDDFRGRRPQSQAVAPSRGDFDEEIFANPSLRVANGDEAAWDRFRVNPMKILDLRKGFFFKVEIQRTVLGL